jgi:protein O-mannosyl-transferase
MPTDASNRSDGLKAALLLAALIGIIYSTSLYASWQFDDLPNIIQNEKLHISDLKPTTLYRTFFASPAAGDPRQDKLFRPVSMLTLALNWYVGQDRVWGYHAVNLCIHFLTAWLLYAAVRRLLASPNLKERYPGREYTIALISAVLWAANPVQTQAVTYIVQRMASLSALFYIGGMVCYLAGRQNKSATRQWICWCGTGLCFLLSLGAKENGIVLPVSLVLIEFLFFRDSGKMEARYKLLIIAPAAVAISIAAGFALLIAFSPDFSEYLNGLYAQRSFTATQRLLTQPRVLLLYLSLLFFPSTERLSLIHEIHVSTSIVQPWTTLPAILAILFLIGIAIWWTRRNPLVTMALLFFLLNQAIEASFIPLEMVFEHRNYLPSLFLFVPMAVLLDRWLNGTIQHRRITSVVSGILLSLIVFAIGTSTWARNKVWATPESLWQDVFVKAPNSARAYQNIADHFKKQKRYREALALYQRALELEDQTPRRSKTLVLNNMANIYIELRDFPTAIRLLNEALDIDPEYATARFNLIWPLTESGRIKEAAAAADTLLRIDPFHPEYLNAKGFLLYQQGRFEEAWPFFKAVLRKNLDHRNASINLGMTFSRLGFLGKSDRLLRRLADQFPLDRTILLCLIENAIRSDNPQKINNYCHRLFSQDSVAMVMLILSPKRPDVLVPYDRDVVAPVVKGQLERGLKDMRTLFIKTEDVDPSPVYFRLDNDSSSGGDREKYELVQSLIKENRPMEAVKEADAALSASTDPRLLLFYKGWALMRAGQLDESLRAFQMAMHAGLHDKNVYHIVGIVMGRKGYHARSEWFLRRARSLAPDDLSVALSLVANRLLAGDRLKAAVYSQPILNRQPLNHIVVGLQNYSGDLMPPSQVAAFLVERLQSQLN